MRSESGTTQMSMTRVYGAGLKMMIKRLLKGFTVPTLKPSKNGAYRPEELRIRKVGSFDEYKDYASSMIEEYENRLRIEKSIAADRQEFQVGGFCQVCRVAVDFHVDLQFGYQGQNGRMTPNWRERLTCQYCGLNNRMRASLHIFDEICNPDKKSAIYITEQTTPVYERLRADFVNVAGSEYLGKDILPGRKSLLGIRNESLTNLTFADDSFDYLLCFDVLEHIPDFEKALTECFRVLKPGGRFIFSVPFDLNSPENIVRASLDHSGDVRHILPAEYHGDPLSNKGCLCFYHFGWELLDCIRAKGFGRAECLFYWSQKYGYLGGDQFIFMAQK